MLMVLQVLLPLKGTLEIHSMGIQICLQTESSVLK